MFLTEISSCAWFHQQASAEKLHLPSVLFLQYATVLRCFNFLWYIKVLLSLNSSSQFLHFMYSVLKINIFLSCISFVPWKSHSVQLNSFLFLLIQIFLNYLLQYFNRTSRHLSIWWSKGISFSKYFKNSFVKKLVPETSFGNLYPWNYAFLSSLVYPFQFEYSYPLSQ